MVPKVSCIAPIGFVGELVEVESDVKKGLPALQIVGLGGKSVDESKERVRSAIKNSMLDFPKGKITINLAPAELPKNSTQFDLSIALSLLCVSGQISQEQIKDSIFSGELALDGTLRPIRGAINIAESAKQLGFKSVYVPTENASQAKLIKGIDVYPVDTLKQLFLHLKGEVDIKNENISTNPIVHKSDKQQMSLDDILGQKQAKRALIIAAAGHHNILMNGPPGSGKTLLAKTLSQLLPPLTSDEVIEVTKLHNLAGESINEIITERPFRSPHHTASRTSLIGGGAKPKPGEISLSHRGVLFLDEIPEYSRSSIESLRQPLEDRFISVNRTSFSAHYPANFMLVATMNPCPCGFYGDDAKECNCSANQILQYKKKLSGPLLDRIDIILNVNKVPSSNYLSHNNNKNTQQKDAIEKIRIAKEAQYNRYNSRIKYNASINNKDVSMLLKIPKESKDMLDKASDKLALSARTYFKTIKVAQTIADIDGFEYIEPTHIAEALQYRQSTG